MKKAGELLCFRLVPGAAVGWPMGHWEETSGRS